MSHTIHKNKAYVLATVPFGEANMFVDLLTDELGLIRASAQGIRFQKSKLRYSVTPLSLIDVSLVRGKEVWRLVGASKIHDFFFELPEEKYFAFSRLLSLLKRLVQGEEPHLHLFELVENMGSFVSREDLNPFLLQAVEEISILRLLSLLGYIEKKEEYAPWLQDLSFKLSDIIEFEKAREEALVSINQALSLSGL